MAQEAASGNIRRHVRAGDGTLSAAWTYGPFGEVLTQTGPAASDLCYRFSTKPFEPATSLVHYQLRPYAPSTGRWLSRDPIEEETFRRQYPELVAGLRPANEMNSYSLVANSLTGLFDFAGLYIHCGLTENRVGDGVDAEIWYVGESEDCPCGVVRFKQRARASGLTTWRHLGLALNGQTHWDL